MCANCIPRNGRDEYKIFSVIFRFDNQQQWDLEADEQYDNSYHTFDKGISDEWQIDEQPEAGCVVTEEKANLEGFQVFIKDNNTTIKNLIS